VVIGQMLALQPTRGGQGSCGTAFGSPSGEYFGYVKIPGGIVSWGQDKCAPIFNSLFLSHRGINKKKVKIMMLIWWSWHPHC